MSIEELKAIIEKAKHHPFGVDQHVTDIYGMLSQLAEATIAIIESKAKPAVKASKRSRPAKKAPPKRKAKHR